MKIDARKFSTGERVRKHSGSWWEGRVVGFYDTDQTSPGYAVQLDMVPNGPVQIYPERALEAAPPLTAALAVQTQHGVEVKKLEWERNGWVEAFAHVNALGLWYSISPEKPVRGAGEPPFACYAIHGSPSSVTSVREPLGLSFLSVDEAQAAAQSDYETRIRSALVDVPAVESEPVAYPIRVVNDVIVDRYGAPVSAQAGRAHPPLSTRKGSAGDGAATGTIGGQRDD